MTTQEVPPVFSVIPSFDPSARPEVRIAEKPPADATAIGVFVPAEGDVPAELRADREALEAAGFDASAGSALVLPATDGVTHVAVGLGDARVLTATSLRESAAAFARAAGKHGRIVLVLPEHTSLAPTVAAQAAVEGALLARYSYNVLRTEAKGTALERLTLVSTAGTDVAAGADKGRILASAQMLARDFANTPHNHLNATHLGEIAQALGEVAGFGVEVFDKARLQEMGCGGLLGVNQGSTEPPRMIKLTFQPAVESRGQLGLVGKGIMYDSGGLSLKPSDPVHAQMKNDMSGAGAILAAFSVLRELECPIKATAYLMCTDNMPSGTAMALGDVIKMRNGTTVEVEDTDAEGRLVLADGLVLAAEDAPDAIVDMATLTGSALRALGPWLAAVIGTNQDVIDQVKAAGEAADEPMWQLPLHTPYKTMLESTVADMKNVAPIGWPDAIIASLFLSTFVSDVPWAHIDICGTAQNAADRAWRTAGCSGFGARLLLEFMLDFEVPVPDEKGVSA